MLRSSSRSWVVVSVSFPFPARASLEKPHWRLTILVYIFVGSLLLHDGVLRYIAGSLVGFIGLGYLALEFIPSIEPPSNMREADQGWGAEQVYGEQV